MGGIYGTAQTGRDRQEASSPVLLLGLDAFLQGRIGGQNRRFDFPFLQLADRIAGVQSGHKRRISRNANDADQVMSESPDSASLMVIMRNAPSGTMSPKPTVVYTIAE